MFSWLDRFQGLGAFVMRVALGVIMVAHGYTKIIPKDALYNFSHMVLPVCTCRSGWAMSRPLRNSLAACFCGWLIDAGGRVHDGH